MEKLFIGRNQVTGEIVETVSFKVLYRAMLRNARELVQAGGGADSSLYRVDGSLVCRFLSWGDGRLQMIREAEIWDEVWA